MNIYIDRIKPLFAKTGKSDKQLEIEIGLPRSIIYKWDNGVNQSYNKYLPKIAEYFDITVEQLLGKEGNKKSPSEKPESDEEKELISIFRTLSPVKQKKLIAQALLEADEQNLKEN